MDIESYIKDLSPELQEKARGCASLEELLALAKEEDVALPDEALATVAGGTGLQAGTCFDPPACKQCGSTNTAWAEIRKDGKAGLYRCRDCGHEEWYYVNA